MLPARLEPVSLTEAVHPACARSIFWELADDATTDPELEKEAWISSMLIMFGHCGHNLLVGEHTRATILYCPASQAPGAQRLPTAPVSPDAHLITSLFEDPVVEGSEAVLIDAVLMDLIARRVPAVEAFGAREIPRRDIGLIPERCLQAAGFEIVADDEAVPRYRLDLPPENGLLTAAEVEALLLEAQRS